MLPMKMKQMPMNLTDMAVAHWGNRIYNSHNNRKVTKYIKKFCNQNTQKTAREEKRRGLFLCVSQFVRTAGWTGSS